MSLVKQTKELCQKYDLRPQRRRGQNFLVDERVMEKIIMAARLTRQDTVLEIGAGCGNLTQYLLPRVKQVVALEIDKKLVQILQNRFGKQDNFKLISADFRRWQPDKKKAAAWKPFKIVANLPYNITGLSLRKFSTIFPQVSLIVLMIQKQVGQRIIAQPPQMSLLSIAVQYFGRPEIVANVPRQASWPQPQVDSVILRILPDQTAKKIDQERFFSLVKAGFSSPRKYLLNNLFKRAILNKEEGKKIFSQLGFDLRARAQELSVQDWVNLLQKISQVQ